MIWVLQSRLNLPFIPGKEELLRGREQQEHRLEVAVGNCSK